MLNQNNIQEMNTPQNLTKRYHGSTANIEFHVVNSGVQGCWERQTNRIIFHLANGGELYWYMKDGSIELLGAQKEDEQALIAHLPCLAYQ